MRVQSEQVTFPAAGGSPILEGVLHRPAGQEPFPATIVCHPHPQMGGTMHNAIVVALCQTLARQGWLGLRFNFRGVEGSAGSFDHGRGEMDDVAGAVDFLATQPEADPSRLALIGYSFGAGVGLHHATSDPRLRWLVAVAPVESEYGDPFLDDDPRPKLFVVGERDPWAPADALRATVERLRPPKRLIVISRCDHFFGGREGEVAAAVADWLAETA